MISGRNTGVLVSICLLASLAGAQLSITSATPAIIGFVDISATGGTALTIFDDSEVHITTTVGNALFPAGDVLVSTNGVAVAGLTSGNIGFTNSPIGATTPSGIPASNVGVLLAFWDDLFPLADAESSTLYWQESAGVLYIMWKNISLFGAATPGQVGTFEIQVFSAPANCGPSVQIIYQDTLFGGTGTSHDNGSSATSGYSNPGPFLSNLQFSHNSPSLTSGTVLTYSSSAANLTASSPFGAGSLQVNYGPSACTAIRESYVMGVVIGPGALENGWFFGLNIPVITLLGQLAAGPPFVGDLSPAGTFQLGPFSGLPTGLQFSAVVVGVGGGGSLNHSGILTYTIP
jgi:hypothetical protein